jgi:hypothetical protein
MHRRKLLLNRAACLLLPLTAWLWPPVHYLLVDHFDMDPWRLGGLAMYATTAPRTKTFLQIEEAGGRRDLARKELTGEVLEKFEEFEQAVRVLGRFTAPDALASAIVRDRPARQAVVIAVERLQLPPRRSEFACQRWVYRYGPGWRELASGGPCVGFGRMDRVGRPIAVDQAP